MKMYCSETNCLEEAVVVSDGESLCNRHVRYYRLKWLRKFKVDLMFLSSYAAESMPLPDHMLDELHELEKEFDDVGGV